MSTSNNPTVDYSDFKKRHLSETSGAALIGPQGPQGPAGSPGAGVSNTTVQNSITIGNTSPVVIPPSGGNRTIQRIESRTVGDKINLTYKLGMTGATTGAGDYLLSLPTGMTFNTAYNPTYNGALWANGVAAMSPFLIPAAGGIVIPGWWTMKVYAVPYDTNRFRLAVTSNGDQAKFAFWSAGYYACNADISVNVQFDIWK